MRMTAISATGSTIESTHFETVVGEWGTGVVADVGRAGNECVLREVWMRERIGDLKDLVAHDRVIAKGNITIGFAHIKTHNTLEPLALRIDQRDRCYLNAEDVLAETHDAVKVLIGRGVENPKRVQLGDSLGVVL